MTEMFKYVKVALSIFFLPIYFLSGFFPRDNKIWVFGSYANKFNDNSKYLFLYIHENYKNIKAVWIAGNKNLAKELNMKGLEAYYRWSLRGIFYALRAGIYIYNSYITDINGILSRGATKINLWHGIPIKKIEFDIKQGRLSIIFNNSLFSKIFFFRHYIRPSYILAPSVAVCNYFLSAFRIGKERCIISGYPRNSLMLYEKEKILAFVKKYESQKIYEIIKYIKKFKKVFIYLPTWRDDNTDFIKKSGINFTVLNEALKNKEALLLIKFHINTKFSLNSEKYKYIQFLPHEIDIYPILPFTDCLITDYSSIFFDYKLLDKEIILFPFDKEEYTKNREFYYDYNFIAKSEKIANDFHELLSLIISGEPSTYKQENKFIRELIGTYSDHLNSCEKIFREIYNKKLYRNVRRQKG